MGEERAEGENIISNHVNCLYLTFASNQSAFNDVTYSQMLFSDNLIFAPEYAFGYNMSKRNSTFEGILLKGGKSN